MCKVVFLTHGKKPSNQSCFSLVMILSKSELCRPDICRPTEAVHERRVGWWRNEPWIPLQSWMCRIFTISAFAILHLFVTETLWAGFVSQVSHYAPAGPGRVGSSNPCLIWTSFVCSQRIHCTCMKTLDCDLHHNTVCCLPSATTEPCSGCSGFLNGRFAAK